MSHRFLLAAATLLFSYAFAVSTTGGMSPGGVQAAQAPAQKSAVAAQNSAATVPQTGYVGSDTCEACHTQGETLTGTAHALAANPRSPAATHGCESCHGPGQAHVDDDDKGHIRKFTQIKPTEINQTCLSCHNRGEHAGWEGSGHERRNLSCTSCHSVHSPKSPARQLVKATQTELCATCHRVQVTKTERAGAWEHAPVKENCATCHDPHGSSNDRMLAVRMPMLCQRCHVATRHPSSIYDKDEITTNKSNRMFGRSCVNCHSNVHGSNHPSGQFYMR